MILMSQHAPGPWKVIQHVSGSAQIMGDNGKGITDLAYVYRCARKRGQANARLIAAAPRMLALLRLVMDDDDTRAQYETEWKEIINDLN